MAIKEHKAKAPKTASCSVITVSDTRNEVTDSSGQLIKELLSQGGHQVVQYHIVRDEPAEIEALLRQTVARADLDAVVVNGGTGVSPRDGTYEVVSRLLEKRLDGFGEIFRFLSYQDIGAAAIMSRALAGVVGGKIMISLPGSREAVELGMRRLVLPELGHMISQARGR